MGFNSGFKGLIQVLVMTSMQPSYLCLTPVTTALTSTPHDSRKRRLHATTTAFFFLLMSTNVAYAEIMLINYLWKVVIMLCR